MIHEFFSPICYLTQESAPLIINKGFLKLIIFLEDFWDTNWRLLQVLLKCKSLMQTSQSPKLYLDSFVSI